MAYVVQPSLQHFPGQGMLPALQQMFLEGACTTDGGMPHARVLCPPFGPRPICPVLFLVLSA